MRFFFHLDNNLNLKDIRVGIRFERTHYENYSLVSEVLSINAKKSKKNCQLVEKSNYSNLDNQ
jgi:hypothetical protein